MTERTALQRAVDMGMHRGVNRKLRELKRSGFATVHEKTYTHHLDDLITQGVIDAADVRKMVELAIVEMLVEFVDQADRDNSHLRHYVSELNKRVDSLALHQFLEAWPERDDERPPLLAELDALATEAMGYDRWA